MSHIVLELLVREMTKNKLPNTKIVKHKDWLIEYRVRTETFKQYLQVFVWDIWEEKHKDFFEGLWLDNVEYNLEGFYDCSLETINIIRLRSYELNTLVHELTHFIAHQCEVIRCEFTEEIPAYIMEEIFCKLMILSEWKFKVNKRFYFM